jgi:hypothetical protein
VLDTFQQEVTLRHIKEMREPATRKTKKKDQRNRTNENLKINENLTFRGFRSWGEPFCVSVAYPLRNQRINRPY